jgi:hypothetical protein
MKLVEIEPGRFRFVKPTIPPARSDLPCPMVISDEMPPTEQVDGRYYTSKAAFRAVGRSLGLIEVGNERPKPRKRPTPDHQARRQSIKKAVARYRAGERVRSA